MAMLLKYLKRTVLFLLFPIALLLFVYFLLDSKPRYLSWYNLNKQELKEKAESYSRNLPVCLYVVDCSTDVPRLKLISDIDKLDLDEFKRVMWARRFYGYCEGWTENILLDFPEEIKDSHHVHDGRWSFFNDRFITNHGRFQGSAGSRYPWEPCTESKATWK